MKFSLKQFSKTKERALIDKKKHINKTKSQSTPMLNFFEVNSYQPITATITNYLTFVVISLSLVVCLESC